MSTLNVLQNVFPAQCPHCSKTLYVSYQFSLPLASSVFTQENVTEAKIKVREALKSHKFVSEEQKTKFEEWLASSDTILGLDDVDAVVKNVIDISNGSAS